MSNSRHRLKWLGAFILLTLAGCVEGSTPANVIVPTETATLLPSDTHLSTTRTHLPEIALTPTASAINIPGLVGKIAFVAMGKQSGVFLIDADGSNMKKISESGGFVRSTYLSWSPDGIKIALTFSSDPTSTVQIYTMNIDGSELTRITTGPHHKLEFSWSPDGKRFAYIEQGEVQDNVVVVNADGTQPRKLTYGGFDRYPTWSPDGSQIAYIHYPDISNNIKLYTMDANGENVHQITDFPVGLYNLAWSPDGTRIAFISDEKCGRVYTVEIATGDLKALTEKDCAKDPTWSSNGAYIAYVAVRTQYSMTDWKLYIVTPDGNQIYHLATFPDLDVFNLSWSP
jgi:Tol biopolymer transport system component